MASKGSFLSSLESADSSSNDGSAPPHSLVKPSSKMPSDSASVSSEPTKKYEEKDEDYKGKKTVLAEEVNIGAIAEAVLPPILGQAPSGELPTPQTGNDNPSWDQFAEQKGSSVFTPDAESQCDACETPKESESPRLKEIMQATSEPRKMFPGDFKSFSHELNSKGVRPFPLWKPRGMYNSKEVLKVIQQKFEQAKEEVNSDLATFAGELVGVMEKNYETHPEWKETLEDLLILARSCCVMTPNDFWLQCEGIVRDLEDRRQELPMGALKKLYTRMLFILTRCTRLLQFHKESGFAEDEILTGKDHENKIIRSFDHA